MSMWRQQCIAAKEYLSDPYLRVMFSFLTAENDSYEEVLVSTLSSLHILDFASPSFTSIILCD